VSRTRNADQFLTEFRRLRQIYEHYYVQLCEGVRRQYTGLPIPADEKAVLLKVEEDALLEAQVRVFMVNPLLGALNWCMVID
jgi:hypothetical protein